MTIEPENLPDDIAALQAALAAEREARQQAEARASSAEALIAHYKLLIAKLRREQYGQSAERGRKLLDQLELQLEEAVASAAENEVAAEPAGGTGVAQFTRRKPVRAPFPAHLPRERIVIPGPTACPCEKNRTLARKLIEALGYGPDKPLKVKVAARNVQEFRDTSVILMDQLKQVYIGPGLRLPS